MAWKIEKWLIEVFPGKEKIYSEYNSLPQRELAIVSAAVLDVALAEIISLRLLDNPKEIESFLGLNEDGRAPAASFGARIQLALLLGIITERDAAILRLIKEIRNKFSHRVKISFLSPSIQKPIRKLYALWLENSKALSGKDLKENANLKTIEEQLDKKNEAGEGLLLAVFTVYQAYFHLLHSKVKRIECAIK